MRSIFFLIFYILVSTHVIAADLNGINKHRLVIVDAGSSGSRLHIYSFNLDNTNTPVNIQEELIKKKSPGLSSIHSDVTTVNTYMDELFKDIKLENIPVYFYATAGMRLLSTPEQKVYYQNVKNWFDNHAQWKLLEAKTIAGQDEGLYGWLAINKKLGRLENNEGYVDFMDMGGASIQLAAVITNTEAVKDKNDVVKIHVFGRDITLFVHSFLGLGQTEVHHQSLDMPDCYSNGYEMADNLAGKGDVQTCEANMEKIINDVHNVKNTIQPVLVDAPKVPWYATGGVVFTVSNEIFGFKDKFSNQAFLDKAQTAVCQQPWENLIGENTKNPFLYGYCQFAAYDYALMVKGYGLNPNQEINYLSTTENFDWTLGVVLSHNKVNFIQN